MSKPTDKKVIDGGRLNYNASIEAKYYKALASLVKQMTSQTQRDLVHYLSSPLPQAYFAADSRSGMDDSVASQARILTNKITRKFNMLFASRAKALAEKMVLAENKHSETIINNSLRKMSGDVTLKTRTFDPIMNQTIKASIAENVALIKSISAEYQQGVQGAVMRSITTGNGLQDLVPYLQKHEWITLRRARLIAKDQTSKALSNLNADRMRSVGIKKFRWIHSGAPAHPRELHVQMDGNIYSLNEPPIIQYAKGSQPEVRGLPGQLINCLCTMAAVVEFDETPKE